MKTNKKHPHKTACKAKCKKLQKKLSRISMVLRGTRPKKHKGYRPWGQGY